MSDRSDGANVVSFCPSGDPRLDSFASALGEFICDRVNGQGISLAAVVGVLEALKAIFIEEMLGE